MGLLKNKNITIETLMFWGFLGTFFFIPVAKSPFIILGILTLSIWVLSGQFIRDSYRLFKHWKVLMPVVLFLVIPWTGLLYTEDINYGLNFARSSYHWLYVFAIFIIASKDYKSEYWLRAFLAGLAFTAILVLFQVLKLIPMRYEGMPTGLLSGGTSHGLLSLFLAFGILVLSFYFKKASTRKVKILVILLILLYFIALSMGLGRNGQLVFIILSPMIIYNLIGRKHLVWVMLGTVLAVVILGMSPIVQERFKEGINDIKQYSEGNVNTSLGLRFYMWKVAKDLFLESPVIGTGTGGFGIAWKKQKLRADVFNFDDPHNTFFYMLSCYGIIGLGSLIWYLFIMLKSGWRERDNIIGFSVLSLSLVFLIGSLTSSLIVGASNTAWVSVFTGLIGVLNKTEIRLCNTNEEQKNI